ncbi:MAG TPA: sugar phosphate isomerase/epimerase family protein [Tepidisphaeraceae bacterium]|jgi:sugar phosphate isomerase/epimerase|nr:sugar phosphate isomerase/epimerase family protein [Tepidisphaeraceae bacterium]
MLKLSAFADEISPDLDEQIRVCRENGVTHFELRGVNNQNVLDFSPDLRAQIKAKLADGGMGVVSIASPIGKIKITEPFEPHFERFKVAVELAEYFRAPLIRIFSYYPPEPREDFRPHRDEVLRRMTAKAEYLKDSDITLVHENEVKIYGEKGKPCLDLMKSINSPRLRSAFDFANFVQAGERPADNWPLLKPYTVHIHIKDALLKDGKVVPAGKGDGDIEAILVDAWRSGYRGFLSLEPHLAKHEQFSGFSGPGLFKVAADALRNICRRNGIGLAGM